MGERLSRRAWGCLIAAALLAVGCGDGEAKRVEAQARLAEVHREGAELHASMSDLEARMHVNRARVTLWKELGQRHRGISAVACDVADSHMLSMVHHVQKNQKKLGQYRSRRVASNAKKGASGTGGGR